MLLEGLRQGKLGDLKGKSVDAAITQRIRSTEAAYFLQEDNMKLDRPNAPEDFPEPEKREAFMLRSELSDAQRKSKKKSPAERAEETVRANTALLEEQRKAAARKPRTMPEPEEEGAEVGSWATTVVLALVAIGGASAWTLAKLARDPEQRARIEANAPALLTPLRAVGAVRD